MINYKSNKKYCIANKVNTLKAKLEICFYEIEIKST